MKPLPFPFSAIFKGLMWAVAQMMRYVIGPLWRLFERRGL